MEFRKCSLNNLFFQNKSVRSLNGMYFFSFAVVNRGTSTNTTEYYERKLFRTQPSLKQKRSIRKM